MALDNILNRSRNIYNFHPDSSIPDLSGKVVIITGANAGLGYQSALQIAQHHPHRLYLTARSRSKYDAAVAGIRKEVSTADIFIRFIEMDLASLSSVKSAAEHLLSEIERIDILMNNAGIMGTPPGLTKEGYEIHFGTNHMGHALFTSLLMPLLLKTAERPSTEVRIVNVSSGAYRMADGNKGFDPALVKTDMKSFRGSNGNLMSRYGQSKLANILHAKGLAKHHPSITSVAIAPGRVKTGLLDGIYQSGHDRLYGYFQIFYDWVVGAHELDVGAYTQLWAATETDKDHIQSGEMYMPIGKKDDGTKFSNDQALVDSLWEYTESELKALGY